MEKPMEETLKDLLAGIGQKRQAILTAKEQSGSAGRTNTTQADGLLTSSIEDQKLEELKRVQELEKHGIAIRYSRTTLEGIERRGLPDNPSIQTRFKDVCNYVSHMQSHLRRGEGIIMIGPVGTMKTQLAVSILRKHLDAGGSGMMVAMATLLDNLYTMTAMNREECVRYEHRLYNTQLLLIDDLGAENNNPAWIKAKIDSIISYRYDHMKPTIITTNCSQQELADTYGGRIFDRVKSNAYCLVFEGPSERKPLDMGTI